MSVSSDAAQNDNFGPVLAALSTLQKTVPGPEKIQASEFLETFQKSVSTAMFTHLAPLRVQLSITCTS